jgi:hypothetical protein
MCVGKTGNSLAAARAAHGALNRVFQRRDGERLDDER